MRGRRVPDGRRRRYKRWQRYYLTRKKALATFLVECAMAACLVLARTELRSLAFNARFAA